MKTVVLFLLLIAPSTLFAQKREIAELQRDILLLQDSVRVLQRTFDEKLESLMVLAQKNLDNASSQNTAVTMMDSTLKERVREMQGTMGTPLANLNSKVDQLANEMKYLRETMADVSQRMSAMERTLTDVSAAVNTMPPPPPGAGAGTAANTSPAVTAPAPNGGAPAVSASTLFENAKRDKSRGNFDLAIMQFEEYVRTFPGSASAPNAQYQIGEVHYIRKEYDKALEAFDALLERFPENDMTALGVYMKGMTLLKLGDRTKGAAEFRSLMKRFPNNEYAAKAKVQLQQMGLR
ncbi:MAG: outer membrane protein assembly factor BamD [Bryobacterales bacterium]|nr:outer membrane protein assembly factor BamD [Bryobacterales bacterium]